LDSKKNRRLNFNTLPSVVGSEMHHVNNT
jgi:hypothetical protein